MNESITRLIKEDEGLQEKITKLLDFIQTDEFSDLENVMCDLLETQLVAMLTYKGLISTRINLLKLED